MDEKGKKVTKEIIIKSKKEFLLKLLTSLLLRGTLLIIPIFWSKAVDYITSKDTKFAILYIINSLVLTMIYYFYVHMNERAFYKLYNKLYKEYTNEVTDATYHNSIYSLSRFSIGEFINIANTDVDVIAAFFSNNVIRLVRILEMIFIFTYFFNLNFYIFLITVFVTVVLLLIFINKINDADEYNIVKKRRLDKKTANIHEFYSGIKEIKGFNVFNNINNRIDESQDKYLESNKEYNLTLIKIKYIILSIIDIVRYLLMLYGCYLVLHGKLLIGSLLIIYNYYGQLNDSFDVIGTFIVEYRNYVISLNRFSKLLEFKQDTNDKKYYKKKEYKGKITFIDVLYGNRNDPILNNVSFELLPNSINIITGKPSSGKTGVFDLLSKINKKHSGDILIDEDDFEKINPKYYYNLFSLCRKNPFFFNMSIKDNFLLIDKDEEKYIEICKMLNIHNYICSLDNGYDTIINDNCKQITNEVRQLLGIARVLLKDSKIMLFDEILSSLETNNQNIVLNILERLKDNHTIVIISREKNILKYGDNIIYMENNMITKITRPNEIEEI